MRRGAALLRAVVRPLLGCSHTDCYRERRQLYGVEVLHFVCVDCGHAAPVIRRTESEVRALFPTRKADV